MRYSEHFCLFCYFLANISKSFALIYIMHLKFLSIHTFLNCCYISFLKVLGKHCNVRKCRNLRCCILVPPSTELLFMHDFFINKNFVKKLK